jgi:site-specific DNA-adenine methylase
MSLTDFKAKMNKYKINNNNKTNTKHEFNVKYERYKQDISKDRNLCLGYKFAEVCRDTFVSTN